MLQGGRKRGALTLGRVRSFFARVVRVEPNFLHLRLRPVAGTCAVGGAAAIGLVLVATGLAGFVGVGVLLGALLTGAYLPSRSLVMNRETGELLVLRRTPISGGSAPAEVSCAIADIVGVEISKRPGGAAGARCELVMQDGSRVPIERAYSRAARKHQMLRDQILSFLSQETGSDPGTGPGSANR